MRKWIFRLKIGGYKNLFAGSPRWSKSKGFLYILPDGHGAQDVEKDEAAVSHVITQQVPVAEPLDPVDGGEGELRYHTAIKNSVEHGQKSRESKP